MRQYRNMILFMKYFLTLDPITNFLYARPARHTAGGSGPGAWVSFFAYALKYKLRLVVVSKLGKLDGAYDSKATLLLPNFETT